MRYKIDINEPIIDTLVSIGDLVIVNNKRFARIEHWFEEENGELFIHQITPKEVEDFGKD